MKQERSQEPGSRFVSRDLSWKAGRRGLSQPLYNVDHEHMLLWNNNKKNDKSINILKQVIFVFS